MKRGHRFKISGYYDRLHIFSNSIIYSNEKNVIHNINIVDLMCSKWEDMIHKMKVI